MNLEVRHFKVRQLPQKPEPNVVYYVLDTTSVPGQFKVKAYITDLNGIPIPLLDLNSGSGGNINSVTGTGVTGSNTDPVIDIATFLSTQINNKLYLSTDDGKLFVKPLISPDGSIDIGENSTEIQIQVSQAIQDSISDILNDINNIEQDILDLQINKFDNPTGDNTQYLDGEGNPTPFPSIPSGNTNLSYTPSPSNGMVNSDTGTDAVISLVDNTNAGLQSPSNKQLVESAVQPGDLADVATSGDYNDLNNLPDLSLKEDKVNKGIANGYGSLDSNGKQPLSEVNDALLGNVHWKGIYDGSIIVSSSDPLLVGQPLPSPDSSNMGWYFISQGSYIYGGKDYETGDWIISNSIDWDKVDNTDAVSAVNGQTGNVVLTTDDIQETVTPTNKWWTNARTIAATLTGYVSGAGVITAADSILSAIQKLNGNISSLITGVSSVFGRTGAVTAQNGDYNTGQVTEVTNKRYVTDANLVVINNTSGVNTGDETNSSIKSKLGQASVSSDGWLSSTDWGIFNNKQSAISLTTSGSSGAATFISNVLNIPNYTLAGLGGQPLDSDLTAIAALTGVSGFLKTNGAGTWSVDTNTYLTSSTGVPSSRTITINGTSQDLSANRTWTVGDALVANPLSQFAATTSAQLAGVISDETGTGALVFQNTPTLSTPQIGGLTTMTGQTLTGTQAIGILDMSQTWNTLGNPTAIKLNVIPTSAGASPLLMDLQRNGTSIFKVSGLSTGAATLLGGLTCAGIIATGSDILGKYFGANSLVFNAGYNSVFQASGTAVVAASGAKMVFSGEISWSPVSASTSTLAIFSATPTINQTGGANGTTWGLRIAPTLTAAADWKSIEWTNDTGYGLYGSGAAKNYIAGKLGLGQTTPTALLHIKAGTATANTAPIKLTRTSAVLNTTPEDGAIEVDGTDIYHVIGSTRYILTRTLVGTAAPATTPSSVGVQFIDTVNKKAYISMGTASSADWVILN